ncbi:hypothetical protein M6B22_09105 [Jatrophihabitans cynanchi]|uniref:Uncharacterized protein n=1 Tax=Jatrophihabitans cynanchi TaxID=2944128 RepID=A0ABY7K4T1_9ACTN|nr:hypothetical protein [Jatrophihabitans sp. SB3-54]WAX58903.1 hypothetical protein M6B22_09105 [Jatrophihabitans sp. SB3-54]
MNASSTRGRSGSGTARTVEQVVCAGAGPLPRALVRVAGLEAPPGAAVDRAGLELADDDVADDDVADDDVADDDAAAEDAAPDAITLADRAAGDAGRCDEPVHPARAAATTQASATGHGRVGITAGLPRAAAPRSLPGTRPARP